MREVRVQSKGLNKERGNVSIGRGGDSCAVATPLRDVPGGSEVSEL